MRALYAARLLLMVLLIVAVAVGDTHALVAVLVLQTITSELQGATMRALLRSVQTAEQWRTLALKLEQHEAKDVS